MVGVRTRLKIGGYPLHASLFEVMKIDIIVLTG